MRHLSSWIGNRIATLYPGCFAVVMATDIISNALFHEQYRVLSDLLLFVSLIAYPILLIFTMARAARWRHALWADLTDPHSVFSFFTVVAASDVLGSALNLRGLATIALLLWLFALTIWTLLIYFSFGVLTFLNTAHGANVVHGGWLIAIVGTESLVVLGTAIAPTLGTMAPAIFLLLHLLWGVGLGLYAIFIALFAYRIFFLDVAPDDITPLLWVVMGAAAISTNAGSTLIMTGSGIPFLAAMRPFIDGVTLLMWGWATWWIPLLLLFGFWKHVMCRAPLVYTPMFWSLVFPMGMYALASLRLALAADYPPLRAVSHTMVWVALGAWAVTAAGFLMASWRSFASYRAGTENGPPLAR